MGKLAVGIIRVALSLAGSAILLFSCERTGTADSSTNEETLMTEYSEDLSVVMSQNGRRSYHFETPLLEGYSLAREPYREFRKGVKITTYQDDSLSTVDVVLTANYAIYYENRELWEAKGNVVAEKSDGKTLYTQQLFWNAKTKKIYSNVDSKIVQNGGRDVFIGEGFESDEAFKDWRFRRMKGRMEVDATAMQRRDSLAADSVADSNPSVARPASNRTSDGLSDDPRRERPSDEYRREGDTRRKTVPADSRRERPTDGNRKVSAGRPKRQSDIPLVSAEDRKPARKPSLRPQPASGGKALPTQPVGTDIPMPQPAPAQPLSVER